MNDKLCKKMRKMAKFFHTELTWKQYYKKWKKEIKHANTK